MLFVPRGVPHRNSDGVAPSCQSPRLWASVFDLKLSWIVSRDDIRNPAQLGQSDPYTLAHTMLENLDVQQRSSLGLGKTKRSYASSVILMP